MSKELEAVKKFKEDCLLFGSSDTDKDKDFKAIVDDNYFYKHMIARLCNVMGLDINPFEDLAETENAMINYIDENECFRVDVATNKKKSKALEIIKEKGINISELKFSYSVNEYNICKGNENESLTQEEYDLLREVLL